MFTLPRLEQLLERFPALKQMSVGIGPRRVPVVRQLTATECGAACLCMVLRYFGRHVELEDLRSAVGTGRDATNAKRIADVARAHGLLATVVALDMDGLEFLPPGSILHWDFQHFVVLERFYSSGARIVDPKHGRTDVSFDQFGRSFTGVAILFETTSSFSQVAAPRGRLAWYLGELLRHSPFIVHIVVVSIVVQAVGLAIPLLTKYVFDWVVPTSDTSVLPLLAAAALCLLLVQVLSSIVRGRLLLYLRTRLDVSLTLGFLEHMLALPYSFFQTRTSGELFVRLSTNATIREALTGAVLSTFLDAFLSVSYFAMLFATSRRLALLTLILATLQVLTYVIARRRYRRITNDALDAQAASQGFLMEILSSMEMLKANGLEPRALERWSALFTRELNVGLKLGLLDANADAISSSLRSASSLALVGLGAMEVASGRLSIGSMLAVSALAAGFLGPVLSLGGTAVKLQLLGMYLERLNDVMSVPREGATDSVSPPVFTGALTVDNLSFRYGPNSPHVVSQASFVVQPGHTVAIVGRTGSGKSTLAKLLVGLLAPDSGRVLVDRLDITSLDPRMVRRQFGVVTQQSQLFSGSIRSNITGGDESVSADDVEWAAEMCALSEDVKSMPFGYETLLIDRGQSLSGGEQQRICLARAILRRPALLVLDEATSQLDARTERQIQANLEALSCTKVIVAHRLSTVVRADAIFVMDRGRIVESGTHKELIRRKGDYWALFSAQMPLAPEMPDEGSELGRE